MLAEAGGAAGWPIGPLLAALAALLQVLFARRLGVVFASFLSLAALLGSLLVLTAVFLFVRRLFLERLALLRLAVLLGPLLSAPAVPLVPPLPGGPGPMVRVRMT